MNRDELRALSKEELIELVLKLQRPTKTSRTSSNPPSTDRKEKRAGSKPGGAKSGHKGHFRALAEQPDAAVAHRPDRCPGCGHVFAPEAAGEVIGAFDRVDLPPVLPVVTRHQRLACACPGCGARVKAPPPMAGSPYGPNIQALALYLKHVQHVSYQRLQAMFADVFGLTISQGALGNMFARAQAAFAAKKAAILARLRTARAVASDETGVRIEGVNAQHWVFRAQDRQGGVVLHETAFSRAAQVVRDVMGGHRPAFWTSDRYSAQQGHGQRHQTCLAHLARDIAFALEVSDDPAPFRLKLWIDDVFALWRSLGDSAASTVARKRHKLEDRIGEILCARSDCDVTSALLRKIANARDQLLTFLDAPDLVQPTNNDCERALRPAVIGRKVTNGFRSGWAAQADAALRTVIDTERLAGVSPYHAIRNTIGPRA
jgi:transposase